MTVEMRVLTVRQPWAWAIVHGGKDVENRTLNIAGDYRGPVAIHVAQQEDANAFSDLSSDTLPALDAAADRHLDTLSAEQALRAAAYPWQMSHGQIIGVVDLIDAHTADDYGRTGSLRGLWPTCSAWAERRGWHLVLANPRPLRAPVSFKGGLGLRRLPADVVQRVLAEVQS